MSTAAGVSLGRTFSAGHLIGPWRVEATLGEGGMGAVYRCTNTDGRVAAVKVLKPNAVEQAEERFEREVDALRRLEHPAIVAIYDSGQIDGMHFMAMELLRGETLEERLAAGPMAWLDACTVFRHVADGLVHAHRHRVFHRDIKPANIMVLSDGSATILDFGIAVQLDRTRLTVGNVMPGTVAYVAPEAFSGRQPEPTQADVYALGLTLYEVLVGRSPYAELTAEDAPSGQRIAAIVGAKLRSGALDPGEGFPDPLRELIRRATSPDPWRRLQQMEQVAERLAALVDGVEPAPFPVAREQDPAETTWAMLGSESAVDPLVDIDLDDQTPARRWPWLALAGALGATLVVGAASVVLAVASWDPEPEPEPEQLGAWSERYALVDIAPGRFFLGSDASERGRGADETLHPVNLSQGIAMGAAEVSQGLYEELMGTNPAREEAQSGQGGACSKWGVEPDLPVFCVTWTEALRFANALSEKHGLEPAYAFDGEQVRWNREATGYRLPTEAEWEYAARAGTTATWGDHSESKRVCRTANVSNGSTRLRYRAWLTWPTFRCDDHFVALAPVGALGPNAWGLHDMVGNVAEWVWDEYAPYAPNGITSDPSGPLHTTGRHVVRGGSWDTTPDATRIAHRNALDRESRQMRVGFRVVRNASP